MRSNPPETLESTLEEILDAVPKTVHLVNPSETLLKPFIYHAYTRETLPTIRVFAPIETFDTVFNDFKTATKAAEITTTHSIAFRISSFDSPPTIIYDNTTLALVHNYFLEDTNQRLASDIHEMLSDNWETTTEYTFNTPSLSKIYESISTTFGSEVLLDVKAIFDAADTLPLSPTTLTLLIAIRHDITIATVTDWAETLNLTTRGTLSRHRRKLETQELITTSPLQTDAEGRPPLTISVIDDTLTDDPETALKTVTETRS